MDCYKKVSKTEVTKMHNRVFNEIKGAKASGLISEKTYKLLTPDKDTIKAGRLYLPPKIHKREKFYLNSHNVLFLQCRAIISNNGAPTERISWYVDQK